MIPYYVFLIIPAFFMFSRSEKSQKIFLLLFLLFLSLFLGLRFEMGTDWYEYSKDYYQQIRQFEYLKFEEFFKFKSFFNLSFVNLIGHMPFYKLGFLISNFFTQNIIFFNILNSIIVVFGFYIFCNVLNLKNSSTWTILTFLMPFLYFVSTDIIRQFSGLVFVSVAFAYLLKSDKKKFVFFTLIGACFHLTSIIFLSILFLIDKKIRIIIIIFIILTNSLTYYSSENIYLIKLFSFYLSDDRLMTYSVKINLLLIFFPFFFIFYFFKQKKFNKLEQKIIFFFILYGFFCAGISIFDDTTSYRLSVYLLIFYSIIITKNISISSKKSLYWFKSSIFTFSLLLLTFWLNFSNHAHVYIPYKSVLFLDKNFYDTKTQVCARNVKECGFVQ